MERFEQLRVSFRETIYVVSTTQAATDNIQQQNKGRGTETKSALKRETKEEAEQRPSKRPAQFVDLTIE